MPYCSLEPRLSVLDFVLQLWKKIKAARQNPKWKAWVRGYGMLCDIVPYSTVWLHITHILCVDYTSRVSRSTHPVNQVGLPSCLRVVLFPHQTPWLCIYIYIHMWPAERRPGTSRKYWIQVIGGFIRTGRFPAKLRLLHQHVTGACIVS